MLICHSYMFEFNVFGLEGNEINLLNFKNKTKGDHREYFNIIITDWQYHIVPNLWKKKHERTNRLYNINNSKNWSHTMY